MRAVKEIDTTKGLSAKAYRTAHPGRSPRLRLFFSPLPQQGEFFAVQDAITDEPLRDFRTAGMKR
jgi:hypothetical protein